MNLANLTDFNELELSLLAVAVIEKVESCENNMRTLAQFDDGPFKDEQIKFWHDRYEIYCLWRVQVLNAQVEVKKRELAKYN